MTKTRWIWVRTDGGETSQAAPTRRPPDGPSALEVVSQSLVEGVRGVLVTWSSREQLRRDSAVMLPKRIKSKSLGMWVVVVGGVAAPGDGRWQLKVAGAWIPNNGLVTISSLWPHPPSNLHSRTIVISCIQKPRVLEVQQGGGLDHATGYIVDLMLAARHHLNFTALLAPTKGMGLLLPNNSYTGMIGVLQRREADMAALDFSPSWERMSVVDFSIPIGEDIVVIISRAPAIVIRPFLLLQIFSPFVSARLFTCLILRGSTVMLQARVRLYFMLQARVRLYGDAAGQS
ncbi:glutamate receptor ionotropic, kainate 5-like [Procambarus clarkii]|uniref:glutamate receptor ionotropic, kainate 5-like n=1 Tax=Procambarus clarkii TaxID=6728 RepID=UPI0037420538